MANQYLNNKIKKLLNDIANGVIKNNIYIINKDDNEDKDYNAIYVLTGNLKIEIRTHKPIFKNAKVHYCGVLVKEINIENIYDKLIETLYKHKSNDLIIKEIDKLYTDKSKKIIKKLNAIHKIYKKWDEDEYCDEIWLITSIIKYMKKSEEPVYIDVKGTDEFNELFKLSLEINTNYEKLEEIEELLTNYNETKGE